MKVLEGSEKFQTYLESPGSFRSFHSLEFRKVRNGSTKIGFWKVLPASGSARKVYLAELWEDFRRVLGRFQMVLLEVEFKRCLGAAGLSLAVFKMLRGCHPCVADTT